MQDLQGKVAVVTGAASGIGRALADRLGRAGMRLALADIEAEPLEAARADLEAAGVEAVAHRTDVSEWASVVALRDAVVEELGAVHLVCNNAGVGGGGQLWECTEDDWRWVLGVNLWGVIHGVRAFVPGMVEAGEGHVVNTASIAGLTSPPFMGPYNVSKHGVVTLSETLRAELAMAAPGVGVSVLCPGWVRTGIAESDRNRPEGSAGATRDAETEATMRAALAGLIAGGIDPAAVADVVHDGVVEGRFYLLTHPEMTPAVHDRVERIVSGQEPAGFEALFAG